MKKKKQQQNPQQEILSILIVLLTNIPFCFLQHLPWLFQSSCALVNTPTAPLGAGECSIVKKAKSSVSDRFSLGRLWKWLRLFHICILLRMIGSCLRQSRLQKRMQMSALQNLNSDRIQFPCLVLLLKECVIWKPGC